MFSRITNILFYMFSKISGAKVRKYFHITTKTDCFFPKKAIRWLIYYISGDNNEVEVTD